ncbi:MAG TPA: FKBP-type peptidyl-prolyl cis-trans isomerase [Candidatus Saccharimonadales bacterium]
MATSTAQRVGIWVIAGAMTIGTVAGFVAMILAPQNEATDQAKLKAAYEQYNKDMADYQKKVDAQAKQLSKKYYATFSKYNDEPAKFTASVIKKLKTTDLKKGTGAEIKDDSSFSAYYIGWNPKGKIFDQSISGKSLKAPFPIEDLQNASVIEGWREGLKGMKIGGIRLIEVPADKAYGESGQGEDIPANTPLKFIVMPITPDEKIPEPEMPKELKKLYGIE